MRRSKEGCQCLLDYDGVAFAFQRRPGSASRLTPLCFSSPYQLFLNRLHTSQSDDMQFTATALADLMLALEVEQSTDYKCLHIGVPYALSASAHSPRSRSPYTLKTFGRNVANS